MKECMRELKAYKAAMQFLPSGCLAAEAEAEKQRAAIAADRKSQVGTGDRSERIRTYNFPENRVSDHRIKRTIYKLDQFLNGDMDEILDALIAADTAEKLKEQSEM